MLSTIPVNKLGYRKRPVSKGPTTVSLLELKSRLIDGTSIADPIPHTIPMRLPSIEQRIALFEQAGAIRAAVYDALANDDFADYLDDLPEEGLSPHEMAEHDIYESANKARAIRKRVSKPAEAVPTSSATPTPSGGAEATPQHAAAPDGTAKGGS